MRHHFCLTDYREPSSRRRRTDRRKPVRAAAAGVPNFAFIDGHNLHLGIKDLRWIGDASASTSASTMERCQEEDRIQKLKGHPFRTEPESVPLPRDPARQHTVNVALSRTVAAFSFLDFSHEYTFPFVEPRMPDGRPGVKKIKRGRLRGPPLRSLERLVVWPKRLRSCLIGVGVVIPLMPPPPTRHFEQERTC